jgi:hypothetical protein
VKARPSVFHEEDELAQHVSVRSCKPHVRLSSFDRFADVTSRQHAIRAGIAGLRCGAGWSCGKSRGTCPSGRRSWRRGLNDFGGGIGQIDAMERGLASTIAGLLLSFCALLLLG